MIIQVLFLFASFKNFKDFHFETSSVYYKILYTYVILVQNFGQLYSIVLLMQSAYSGFGCFCLFSALQSQDEELIFFLPKNPETTRKKNHLIEFMAHILSINSEPMEK